MEERLVLFSQSVSAHLLKVLNQILEEAEDGSKVVTVVLKTLLLILMIPA